MSAFEKLAPFIQDYIYRHKWQELNETQVASCDIIFNTDNNLIISAPTAAGKTEAAFLPVITEIINTPPSSVGVLYIAPLKALINDQFIRIEKLLEEADITVTKWHGDAPRAAKDKLLKNPRGVLQITPESLEAMLMKSKQNIIGLFSDLRYVIIDELHNFIATDRGLQLSSILERIQNLTGNTPRRVALSATLGDIGAAEEWLNAGTKRACNSPIVNTGKRKAQIMLSHFYVKKNDPDDRSWLPYYEFLYSLVKGQKSIVFSNSRSEVEINMNRLKVLAESKNERDIFHVHHGSISAVNREYTEEQMRTSEMPLVTGATVTLELGIDLGDLERIVQTGCPHSVSSLAQRLGRSGRRSGVSKMCFVIKEDSPKYGDIFYETINWEFVKCIALIELYSENWLEPLCITRYPYNILFHQIMSVLFSYGEISPKLLAQKMLSEETFSHIDINEFGTLLKHMVKIGMLEKTSEGKLLIGEKGERLTNNHDFYTVFQNRVEYSVRECTKEIGTLLCLMRIGSQFVLSGKTWEVIDVDNDNKVIYVKYVGGKSTVNWFSDSGSDNHTKVLKKMREILVSDGEYRYLHQGALARLSEIRKTIRLTGMFSAIHQTDIFPISPNCYGIFPWLGTRAINALTASLHSMGLELSKIGAYNGIQLGLSVKVESGYMLNGILYEIKNNIINTEFMPEVPDTVDVGKYGNYLPPELVYKQYVSKYFDVNEMRNKLTLLSVCSGLMA